MQPVTDLEARAFAALTEAQIALLRSFGEVRATRAGDVRFKVGDASYPLIVVLEVRTEIIDRAEGEENILKSSGPGEFHGELGLLTGQVVLASCVVREPGEVLLVPLAAVREVIATIPELSDLLVMAFVARRQLLMRRAAATLTIIGPETSHAPLLKVGLPC